MLAKYDTYTSYKPSAKSVGQVMDRVFSPSFYGQSSKRAGSKNKGEKNKDP